MYVKEQEVVAILLQTADRSPWFGKKTDVEACGKCCFLHKNKHVS